MGKVFERIYLVDHVAKSFIFNVIAILPTNSHAHRDVCIISVDYLVTSTGRKSRHVAVYRDGMYYKIDLYSKGRMVKVKQLEKLVLKC